MLHTILLSSVSKVKKDKNLQISGLFIVFDDYNDDYNDIL